MCKRYYTHPKWDSLTSGCAIMEVVECKKVQIQSA